MRAMRALWSIVVVCLVAARGVAPAAVRSELRTTSITDVASTGIASNAGVTRGAAIRPVLHAVPRRARDPGGQLPPAALATAFSHLAPDRCAIEPAKFARVDAIVSMIRTGSARGPPIG